MFAWLGRIADTFRWPIIGLWIALAVIITLLAPNIDEVAVNDQRAFLAEDAPSLEAAQELQAAFPDRSSPASAVVVIDAGDGGSALSDESGAYVAELTEWLRGDASPEVIDRVTSPVGADEGTVEALTGDEGRVAMIVVYFSSIGTEDVTKEALATIDERLADTPSTVDTYLTGDAAIIGAYDQATRESLDSTTWITIVLVIGILLAVYRSPVSPVIPLATIVLAYLISRGLVAFLGDGVMTISGYTNIFLIVILFGAGTDYCLFLISRFREEKYALEETCPAVRETVRTVGETIASSAGTVVVGLSTMALAELGLFNTTGPSVAIGVIIALAAGLTFTPALLSVLGERAFWPRRAQPTGESGFWKTWSDTVTGRPWAALALGVVLLAPLAWYGQGQARTFDLLADLPDDMEAKEGFEVLSDSLGAGAMQPLTVVLRGDEPLTDPRGLRLQREIVRELADEPHVAEIRGFLSSLDDTVLQVDEQLEDQADGVAQARDQLEQLGPLAALAGPEVLERARDALGDLGAYLDQLAAAYPDVQENPEFRQATTALEDIRALDPGEGLPAGLDDDLTDLEEGLRGLGGEFAGREAALLLPETYLENNEGLDALRTEYFDSTGSAARLQIILDTGPYSEEALETVDELRGLLDGETAGSGFALPASVEGYVEGSSAVVADLQSASGRDMVRSIVYVLIGVFVVLILLLRALVAPIYLILTILLSYGATLGIVRVVFTDILGTAGVTWWVPIFMFVMLVALGMDYNIFLMGRVKEEVEKSSTRSGTARAVAATGGIITSAGLIMAGTFAAMLSAEILGLIQIGFAVSVGVLLDTFVVRTALVPAIAVLLGRWSWWPRRPQESDGPGATE